MVVWSICLSDIAGLLGAHLVQLSIRGENKKVDGVVRRILAHADCTVPSPLPCEAQEVALPTF